MTEQRPEYDAGATVIEPLVLPTAAVVTIAADDGTAADMLRVYFLRRREALIIELRALDRALGRSQTIPERTR